jgi:hypothetical protein
MLLPIFILSAVFFGLAFIITENNASYLLSGYNTMSEKERRNFDIKSYLSLFKKFHIFLGLSLLVFSLLIFYFINSDYEGIFLVTYPILAYFYLMWKSKSFYIEKNRKQTNRTIIGIIVLLIVCAVILVLFTKTLKNNEIIISENNIEITEDYGIILNKNEIQKLELVDQLPEIGSKLNGTDLETILKGNFKLATGEKVKLFINSETKPIILITTTKNFKIYYSSKNKSNDSIFKELNAAIKN